MKVRRRYGPAGRLAFVVGLGDGQEWSNDKRDAQRSGDIDIRRTAGPGGELDQLQVVATPRMARGGSAASGVIAEPLT